MASFFPAWAAWFAALPFRLWRRRCWGCWAPILSLIHIYSLITEGCEVKGVIKHSVLFAGVTVETGAEITDAVVMPGAVIERGAVVRRTIVAENRCV